MYSGSFDMELVNGEKVGLTNEIYLAVPSEENKSRCRSSGAECGDSVV